MPPLFIWIIISIASLIVLVKASDFFTESAEKIGISLGIPHFVVGVTIVAIGTSLPELVSSLFAVYSGSPEIVAGNVVGSNIANIFLIGGLAALIGGRLKITHELLHVDLPFLVGSAIFLGLTMYDGIFTMGEGIFAILALIIYIGYTIYSQKTHEDKEIEKEMKADLKKKNGHPKTYFILTLSALFIFLAANYTIESVIQISDIIGIGKDLIAVSAVAFGTSLPEVMVSISAARKGKPEISVGNILGSNVFNSFAVMGIPSFIGAITVPKDILTLSLPIMGAATLLYYFITHKRDILRWEGAMLVVFYAFFITKLIGII